MTFKVLETPQLDSAVCLRSSVLRGGTEGEEGRGGEGRINNHAAIIGLAVQGQWRLSRGLFLSSILHGHKSFSYLVVFASGTDSKAGWTQVVL